MTRACFIVAGFLLPLAAQAATSAPQRPFRYVDPTQLALPFPYYSLVRQPWRAYLEATPAATYLNGLGVVWGGPVPGKSDAEVAAELAWAGFRRVRIEFPWSALRWDETGAQAQFSAQLTELLGALKASGLRPLILLNANHSAPCPLQTSAWRLASAARTGDREIQVAGSPTGIVPMFSMVSTLSTSGHAGPLVTGVSSNGVLTLSRPLTSDLQANTPVGIARLKYEPLFPVGTQEFENTATGWLTYVAYVIHFMRQVYGPDFDLEMWNELTFGSDFLDVNHYFEPPLTVEAVDFLHAGGSAWELARRTSAEVRQLDPAARLIWGFSNTTFFHTAVADLPPGFSGQSYHPYGVGPRCYAKLILGRERYNADGFVPAGCAIMPEGWAHTFQQTETLMRLLNPEARVAHPPGVGHFEHYMTEHGLSPAELGIHDQAQALRAKEKFLLRAPLLWLNKGISALYVYDSFDGDDAHFGVLQHDGGISPAMGALHRLVSRLGTGAAAPATPAALDASVEQLTGTSSVYPNDPDGRYVTRRQTVAVLPFALAPGKLAIAAYVMTENFPQDLAPQRYRITLRGLEGSKASVTCYDPMTDSSPNIAVNAHSAGQLSIDVQLTDTPRLLEIDT
jgi:hypothetical protein